MLRLNTPQKHFWIKSKTELCFKWKIEGGIFVPIPASLSNVNMPPIELKIHRCGNSLWQMFRQYRYLNGKLGAGVRCYAAIYQNKPIAFIAVVCTRMRAKYYRVSRLVVLPDYQGIGVGKRLLNFIADLYYSQTKLPFLIVTSNPQIIRGNLKGWKLTRFGHACRGREDTRINNEIKSSLSRKRITVSMQYIKKN